MYFVNVPTPDTLTPHACYYNGKTIALQYLAESHWRLKHGRATKETCMSKYPVGRHIHICQECGHPLGLKTPVWWGTTKFCSMPCKKLYRARWWRDWRERMFAKFLYFARSTN